MREDGDFRDIFNMSHAIRTRVLEQVLSANGGYLSQACSSAELMATLYGRVLRLGPSEAPAVPPPYPREAGLAAVRHLVGRAYNGPLAPDLDRFVFSPTHYAMVLYATLIETGRLAPESLATFNHDGSVLEMIGGERSPGHEATGGSFGQAISQAAGIAVARRLKGHTGRVWLFMSDGELQEGQTWEAFLVMRHHRINNLKMVVDVNNQQVDGAMDEVMGVEPLADKLRAFGATVVDIDGHDPSALLAALETEHREGPLVVLARTDPARGMDLLRERFPHLHYIRFKTPEERQRYEQLLETMKSQLNA